MKKYLWIAIIFSCLSCNKEDVIENSGDFLQKIDLHTTESLTDISFINENQGVICGTMGVMAKTNDGGRTWDRLYVGVSHSFLSTYMLNESNFFTARKGLYKTSNSGFNFNEIGNFNAASIYSINFIDDSLGMIVQGSRILRTTDGGVDWTETYNTNAVYSLSSLQFINNVGYACGGYSYDNFNAGEVVKSTDYGMTWSMIVSSIHITSVYFVDESIGFYTNVIGEVFKTVNGGTTWVKLAAINSYPNSISFKNQNIGYSSTLDGKVLKTENGGANWRTVYDRTNEPISKVIAIGNSVFAIGNNGLFLRSN